MYTKKNLDQKIIYFKKKMDPSHFNYQKIKCDECKKTLKIAQVQRKYINQCLDFAVFYYYCLHCKLNYYIFKFINRKEDLNNEF